MKKSIAAMLIVSFFVLVGCSPSEDVTEDNTSNSSTVEAVSKEPEAMEEEVIEGKDIPERKAEVSGIVKNIIGNEVTISLILKDTQSEGVSEETVELTDAEKAAKQAANKAAKELDGSSSGTGLTEVELSGETVDIIIPVGTTVLKSSGIGDGEFINLNIGDIHKGDTVKIWIIEGGEEEVKLAEFVQVLTR